MKKEKGKEPRAPWRAPFLLRLRSRPARQLDRARGSHSRHPPNTNPRSSSRPRHGAGHARSRRGGGSVQLHHLRRSGLLGGSEPDNARRPVNWQVLPHRCSVSTCPTTTCSYPSSSRPRLLRRTASRHSAPGAKPSHPIRGGGGGGDGCGGEHGGRGGGG
jgi:hypothetical protein